MSKNGAFVTLSTERLDPACEGWACLAVLRGDLSTGEVAMVGGEPLRSDGRAAVSDAGDLLALVGQGAAHEEEVLISRSVGGAWSAPVAISGDSPHDYNNDPVLSASGDTVLFNCGPTPYGQEGTGVCEVGVDGARFRQLVDPREGPGVGSNDAAARSADCTADGGIVFESDWNGEQLWWLGAEATTPVAVSPEHTNDNSPCALPGGFFASLWLGRPGTEGLHEIKITAPDGSSSFMALVDVDVADVGMSCHEPFVP